MDTEDKNRQFAAPPDISDDDVVGAMREIGGYLDITPGDLKEVMRAAYRHALRRIANAVHAGDIMKTPVHSVRIDTPVSAVVALMARQRISGVPVLDRDEKIAGVISERDFLRLMGAPEHGAVMSVIAECMNGSSCLALPMKAQVAADIMTAPAITVNRETPLFQIMEIFSSKKINRAPVVDDSGSLAGIVTRADIIASPVAGLR
ncbi:MAG: CBS domain-containing protein [Nitrospiraceae bacterium]|nr:CBS domain-containing protein [Nitrospiraceae bacterium]